MKRGLAIAVALALVGVSALVLAPHSAPTGGSPPAGGAAQPEPVAAGARSLVAAAPARFLIGWDASAPPPLLAGSTVVRLLPRLGIAILAAPDTAAALAAYRGAPGVEWAEPDQQLAATGTPNNPLYAQQWTLQDGPQSLDWPSVYPAQQGQGALVAVLDTGFQPGGPDAPVNLRQDLAKSFVPGSSNASDDNGHGTFVTDLIAAATDTGAGAAGIAPEAGIVPVKVLSANGTGDLSVVAEGIDYAVSIGAKVINLSLAGTVSFALCAAVARAAPVAVVVAASGNDSSPGDVLPLDYPAACPGALAVGSIAYDGTRPSYANVGCTMAVVAPGGDDLALFNPGTPASDWIIQQGYDPNRGTFTYMREEGTSMSAAEVSGEAALLVGMGASPRTARRLIIATARKRGGFLNAYMFGAGLVDIGAAVAAFSAGAPVGARDRGYQLATVDGRAVTAGDGCGDKEVAPAAVPPSAPIVGEAATPDGLGSWLVGSDGGVFTFGDAGFYGSPGGAPLNQPVVGMASTPSGHGYWLVARDGGIFAFGDAKFYGSTGGSPLNQPITGMAPTPSGHGYWLVARDGGIFAFGDATFYGSPRAGQAGAVVGMAVTSSGHGYWLAAADGSVFGFGDAVVYAGTGGTGPVVGIVTESRGNW